MSTSIGTVKWLYQFTLSTVVDKITVYTCQHLLFAWGWGWGVSGITLCFGFFFTFFFHIMLLSCIS